ncbi:MAG TPA: pilus assembly protein PilM [Solirubrobacteraceae bacterium]|nr:pilus assembly protein PilM [Solirubrobacteraceae bacterium]
MFKKRSSSQAAVVGLDLDPGHIAAAEVTVNGSLSLKRGAVAPLRPGVLRDGEVADVPALAEALKTFFAENGLSNRVRLGIANQRIVVRTLDLPPLGDDKALAAAVKVQAPDHIPMPMDEAVIDWQSLGTVHTPSGQERTRVVVVAVRREMVDRLVAASREAGLKLEGIDLSAFGMVRALAGGRKSDGAVLYVSVAGLTNVAVANGSGCLFTRAAAGGLDAMVHTLAERRGLTVEHARQWMGHVGLHAPLDAVDGDEDLVTAARGVLEEGVHQLADTVRNSLNFYRMQESAEQVETGVLTGPAVAIPGFVESLSEQLRLPLESAVVGSQDEEADLGRLTVAAGLAVEDVA